MNKPRYKLPSSRQAGLTLIELVISMGLATLVMTFVFGVSYQTSQTMRGFAKMGEHTDGIIAARELISTALRTAGSHLPTQGLRVSTSLGTANAPNFAKFVQCQPGLVPSSSACAGVATHKILHAVNVRNGTMNTNDASDQILMLRGVGDPILAYPTTAPATPLVVADVASAALLAGVSLIAVTDVTGNTGCLVRIDPPATAAVSLVLVGPPAGYVAANARALPLTAAAFENVGMSLPATICPWNQPQVRIIPVEADWFYLSPNDRLLNQTTVWSEVAAGTAFNVIGAEFTNLQFALRFVEPSEVGSVVGGADADRDGQPQRDWYSANQQLAGVTLKDQRITSGDTTKRPADGIPIAVGVTVQRRSTKFAELRTTATRPLSQLLPANMVGQFFNNSFGDQAAVNLTNSTDLRYISERNVANFLDPDNNSVKDGLPYVYSASTTIVALRNAGGGL
ncbi:MAG: prepilin-type N-terminal cleavage/methylation domain-containing protein [Kofleriaceae bacterium]|nr:prepilin-type N-terminal cleavage/methylation domain-containing protein [Kofleriaceae bacterium]